MLRRVQLLLAALWGGFLLCVAGVAAPTAFKVLERAGAISYVRRLFELDAQLALAAGIVLMVIDRRHARDAGGQGATTEFLLPAGALLCTVLGYYVLQPQMEAAMGTPMAWKLHLASMAFFAAKTGAVLTLAWKLSRAPSS
ncbi:MAG: DUF4149 domain-containing protein [Paucibacter sp.]|nr:DUF4149 domain-containing protein [Roseateles sp.]